MSPLYALVPMSFVFAAFSGLAGVSAWCSWREIREAKKWPRISALVLNSELRELRVQGKGRRRVARCQVLKFEYEASGTTHRVQYESAASTHLRLLPINTGDRYELLVDPQNPKRFRLDTRLDTNERLIVAAFAAFGAAAVALFVASARIAAS